MYLDSSIYSSDIEEVIIKSSKYLSTYYLVSITDLIKRENRSPVIRPGSTSNLIYDINPRINGGDLGSDNDNNELCYSLL